MVHAVQLHPETLNYTAMCEPPVQPTTPFMLLIWPLLLCAARGGGDGRKGVFIELGAYDGITSSNTLLLEKCHSWRGVLIEGNPTNYHLLARSGRNASRLVHSAVSSRCHGGVSNFTVTRGEVSGIAEVLDVNLRKFKSHYKQAKPYVFTQVPCKRLSSIFDESLALLSPSIPRRIDFLSLDTEGTEDVVLASLLGDSIAASVNSGLVGSVNSDRDPAEGSADATESTDADTDGWLPKVVLVESSNGLLPDKDDNVHRMLLAANYTRQFALEEGRGALAESVRNRVYTRLRSADEIRCSKLLAQL